MKKEELERAQVEMRERMKQGSHETNLTSPQNLPQRDVHDEKVHAKSLHRLAAATGALLRHAPSDKNGIIIPPSGRICLDIRVSKAQLQRAVSIASALLFGLEEKGFTVTARCPGNLKTDLRPTSVQILDQDVSFYIEEGLQVKERRQQKWSTRPELIYEPSGKLILRVSSCVDQRTPCPQKWADRKTQSLEGLLPQCVEGLIKNAERMAMMAAERQARELKWEMERKEQAEQQRRMWEEEARRKEEERLYALAHPNDPEVLKKQIAELEAKNEALQRERESESIRHSYEKENAFWAGRNRRW